MTTLEHIPVSKSLLIVAPMMLATVLAGCVSASSHVLVGSPRPPIDPSQVHVYLQPPAQYQQIALVQSSSRGAVGISAQARTDKLMERLKREAAALGANGLVLKGVDDQAGGAVGLDSAHLSNGGKDALGFGVSNAVFNKAGTAVAIYVPTDVSGR